jgi:hypothetical protein
LAPQPSVRNCLVCLTTSGTSISTSGLRGATRLAATVHTPQKFQIDTDFSFLLANGIEQRAVVHFTHAYLPWMFALGLAHDLVGDGDRALAIAGTVLYAR